MHHYEMLRNVSRTFALSIEQLPRILRETVTIGYLMFRISDCFEDHETLKAERKVELLRLWTKVLCGECPVDELTGKISSLDGSDPEVYVAQNAHVIIQRLHELPHELRTILVEHVNKTSLGMARWQEHGPYMDNEEDLDDYMLQVAGRVGYLLTDVFSWYSASIRKLKEKLMPLGREFGLALQTVNIIRGMRKDYERGWVFVPVTFYKKVGLTRDGLFDPANIDKAMKVIDMLADKAERHLRNALSYTTLLPRTQHHIRLFCLWPLLFAATTLAISRNNSNVLTAGAKITRSQVKKIMFTSKLFSWSNFCLTAYYKSLYKANLA
jgi:farnesyl-diphosphate farnesyltransferase